MKYNPALDGLRAVAISMVLTFHALTPHFEGGYLGVDVFFVLSGFLITSILTEEAARTGSIDLRRFYLRRFIRLTPALVTMLMTYLLLAPLAWPRISFLVDLRDAVLSLFYLSDYSNAFWSVPVMLRHGWSLSVEEHYYLVWPLLLLVLLRLSSIYRTAIAVGFLYLVFTVWRIYWDLHLAPEAGYTQSYYRFDTRLSGLMLGSFLSLVVPDGRNISRFANLLSIAALSALAFCVLHFRVNSVSGITYGITVAELATLALIIVAARTPGSALYSLLSTRLMTYVGRLSYGIYLWHYPLFFYMWGRYPWYAILTIGGTLAVLLAMASYYTVERAARSYWKDRNPVEVPAVVRV